MNKMLIFVILSTTDLLYTSSQGIRNQIAQEALDEAFRNIRRAGIINQSRSSNFDEYRNIKVNPFCVCCCCSCLPCIIHKIYTTDEHDYKKIVDDFTTNSERLIKIANDVKNEQKIEDR